MRVRLTPDEHAAWSAARAVTGRRELGAWLRVTVNELLGLSSGERLDRPEPVPPIVDAQTYLTLVTAANALGELVTRANAEQRYPAEREANEGLRPGTPGGRGDPGGDRHGHGTGPAAPVIAVIRKGSDFGHAAQYLFGPGDGGPSTSNGR